MFHSYNYPSRDICTITTLINTLAHQLTEHTEALTMAMSSINAYADESPSLKGDIIHVADIIRIVFAKIKVGMV